MAYGNALLPLAVDVPDIAGAYFRGQQMYGAQQEMQNQNALRAAMQQYGPAAMRGDQNALAQLAQFDPQLGLSMMGDQQAMDLRGRADVRAERESASGLRLDEARLGQIRESQRMAAAQHAMQMDAATREREAVDSQREAAMLTMAYKSGPEEWARVAPGILGGKAISFEDAPYIIAGAQGSVEGLIGESGETAEMRNLRFRAEQGGLQPGTPEYQNFMANGGMPRGTMLSVGADGSVEFSDGAVPGSTGMIPKPPSGFANVPQPDGSVTQAPIEGGPGTQISGDIAGRIALARDSLAQIDGLIGQAAEGKLTGPIDWATGRIGRGEQGEARRENMAGAEAITRMLTGAGMNLAEAQREVELYIVAPTDDARTAVSKLTQLKRRLTELVEVSERGRAGSVAIDPSTGMGVPPAATPADEPLDSILERYR